MTKLMTVKEVAELLGVKKVFVYQNVYKKRLPAIKVSKKCLRFDPAAIENWLKEKTQQPVQVAISHQPARKSPGRPRKYPSQDDFINKAIERAKKEVGV